MTVTEDISARAADGSAVVTGGNIVIAMARRPWRTQRLPDLVGSAEACEILGIQKMTLNRWMRPGSGPYGDDRTYMIPPKRIKASPVWVRSDIERFADEIGRQRARAGEAKASVSSADMD